MYLSRLSHGFQTPAFSVSSMATEVDILPAIGNRVGSMSFVVRSILLARWKSMCQSEESWLEYGWNLTYRTPRWRILPVC